MQNPRIVALLVAGGSARRTVAAVPKQYRRLGRRSVLALAAEALALPRISAVRAVIGEGHEALFHEAFDDAPAPPFTIGGATRKESVRAGLEAIEREGGADWVLVHDAARPFLPSAVVDRLLGALEAAPGAVPVLPVVDTLARSDATEPTLGPVVPRETLIRVQTPQAFHFGALLAAHRGWNGGDASDDAQMLRAAGHKVVTVAGDAKLEKLTYEADILRAEALMGPSFLFRVGQGHDVHAFGPGDGVWLGGVLIPFDRSLRGHSDADVLLHALTDALLGAIGAGDIGDHFPPSDPQWRGAASALFLEHALGLVEQAGGEVVHIDATILCEAPKIGPHRREIRERIAGLMRLPMTSISIKATTTERLGFTGRGEGVAATAIATIRIAEPS